MLGPVAAHLIRDVVGNIGALAVAVTAITAIGVDDLAGQKLMALVRPKLGCPRGFASLHDAITRLQVLAEHRRGTADRAGSSKRDFSRAALTNLSRSPIHDISGLRARVHIRRP